MNNYVVIWDDAEGVSERVFKDTEKEAFETANDKLKLKAVWAMRTSE